MKKSNPTNISKRPDQRYLNTSLLANATVTVYRWNWTSLMLQSISMERYRTATPYRIILVILRCFRNRITQNVETNYSESSNYQYYIQRQRIATIYWWLKILKEEERRIVLCYKQNSNSQSMRTNAIGPTEGVHRQSEKLQTRWRTADPQKRCARGTFPLSSTGRSRRAIACGVRPHSQHVLTAPGSRLKRIPQKRQAKDELKSYGLGPNLEKPLKTGKVEVRER